jgi:hypothetical protein
MASSTSDRYLALSEASLNDPQCGDSWTEMYAWRMFVLHVVRNPDTNEVIGVITADGSPPLEVPDELKLKAMTHQEFKKWLSYGSIRGTWADCYERGVMPQNEADIWLRRLLDLTILRLSRHGLRGYSDIYSVMSKPLDKDCLGNDKSKSTVRLWLESLNPQFFDIISQVDSRFKLFVCGWPYGGVQLNLDFSISISQPA